MWIRASDLVMPPQNRRGDLDSSLQWTFPVPQKLGPNPCRGLRHAMILGVSHLGQRAKQIVKESVPVRSSHRLGGRCRLSASVVTGHGWSVRRGGARGVLVRGSGSTKKRISPGEPHVISYRATLDVPAETLTRLAAWVAAHHRAIRDPDRVPGGVVPDAGAAGAALVP